MRRGRGRFVARDRCRAQHNLQGKILLRHSPFVMNTREEIVQAFADFQAGRLGTIPPDQLR
jgi:hypothetical protein